MENDQSNATNFKIQSDDKSYLKTLQHRIEEMPSEIYSVVRHETIASFKVAGLTKEESKLAEERLELLKTDSSWVTRQETIASFYTEPKSKKV